MNRFSLFLGIVAMLVRFYLMHFIHFGRSYCIKILRRKEPVKCGIRALPYFYFVCIFFNVFAVLIGGSKSLKWIEKKELEKTSASRVNPVRITDGLPTDTVTQPAPYTNTQKFSTVLKDFVIWLFPKQKRENDSRTLSLFSAIQVFTACFAGFAHGTNDVSNAIAPLSALIAIYDKQSAPLVMQVSTPLYVVVFGVVATCTGLWLLGHLVIRTVGQEMSEINPASLAPRQQYYWLRNSDSQYRQRIAWWDL
ncbi:unnamed protein product [Bursaphelenchus okinawaensis]|uniref:Phosphate transporter n=1 Tax=Bursaphelenchus okinawaensis TaxID=465554 RepID=A0A811L901_9BILA|nr:unnamed protein product [Bursaphelenchus okinawaensis]CAG9120213.1 unnamed protein product [Bursaphelenchus okinawaensis]